MLETIVKAKAKGINPVKAWVMDDYLPLDFIGGGGGDSGEWETVGPDLYLEMDGSAAAPFKKWKLYGDSLCMWYGSKADPNTVNICSEKWVADTGAPYYRDYCCNYVMELPSDFAEKYARYVCWNTGKRANLCIIYLDANKQFISYESEYKTIWALQIPATVNGKTVRYIKFHTDDTSSWNMVSFGSSPKEHEPMKFIDDVRLVSVDQITIEVSGEGDPQSADVFLDTPLRGIEDTKDVIDIDSRTITRKIGSRAYQSGDKNDSTMLTDKETTLYVLPEPTTEPLTADVSELIALNSYDWYTCVEVFSFEVLAMVSFAYKKQQ